MPSGLNSSGVERVFQTLNSNLCAFDDIYGICAMQMNKLLSAAMLSRNNSGKDGAKGHSLGVYPFTPFTQSVAEDFLCSWTARGSTRSPSRPRMTSPSEAGRRAIHTQSRCASQPTTYLAFGLGDVRACTMTLTTFSMRGDAHVSTIPVSMFLTPAVRNEDKEGRNSFSVRRKPPRNYIHWARTSPLLQNAENLRSVI